MVSQRILDMTPSATSTLGGKIAEMKAAGINIAAFNLGEPDFPTPEKITKACMQAAMEGQTKYIAIGGILPLRQAISEKLEKDNNVRYDPSQICVSTGAKQAVFNAVMALVNPGDEVIIPTPCWVSYVEMVKLDKGIPVLVSTLADFQLDLRSIEAAVTNHTRAIIINTPNNPTGASYPEQDLRALAELAVRKDFYVISDEVYEKLIYGNTRHVSIASLSSEIYDRTVTINGFSKAYSMTGWRLGYSAAPMEIAKGIVSLQGHITTNSTTFVQYAGITALKECDEEIEKMRQEFLRRRDYMLDRLLKIEGITCPTPGGAFYLMPDVSAYFGKRFKDRIIENSVDFCNYMLEEAQVAIVPGSAFEMPNAVRFAYSVSIETIEQGMNRFEAAINNLK